MQTKYRKLYLALRAVLAVPAVLVMALPSPAQAAEAGVSTSYTWKTGNGAWDGSPTNWGPSGSTGFPGDTPAVLNDNASINSTLAAIVTYSSGNRTIQSLAVGDNVGPVKQLNISGGTLTVGMSSVVNAGVTGVVNEVNVSGTGTLYVTNNFNVISSATGGANSVSKTTVSGGTLRANNINNTFSAAGSSEIAVSSGTVNNVNNFNNTGKLIVSGTGVVNAGNLRNTSTGSVSITDSGIVNNTGASGSNTSTITLTGGTLNNSGVLGNSGTINNLGGTFNNSGTVNSTGSVSGGIINNNAGAFNSTAGSIGNTSTTFNQNAGTLLVSNSNTNTVGTLNITGGTTNLSGASSKISVASDYTNTGFGSGNSFDARAGVTGAGVIVAAADAKQGLIVNGGAASNAANLTMNLGNVHVGDSTSQTYKITNTGTTGPVIRGAIQDSSITDGRLSGTGVTAANYTPNTGTGTGLALGASTSAYNVAFAATAAGALSGQAVQIVDNFGDKQTLSIQAAGWRLAEAGAHTPEPVKLTNVHLNDTFGTQTLSIQNTAASDGYSEKLNASISAAPGNASASGSFTLLAAQATNNSSLTVGLGGANTTTVGLKQGTATITLTSDGEPSGTVGNSGLGTTALASQTVSVQGEVWRLATASPHAPEPVSFGAIHVNQSFVGTQTLSIQNTAASDGYSEKLNASIGNVSGAASASGAFTLLAAQATNNSSLTVGLGNADTTTAGTKTGTATITLVSDGEASGTVGNSGLGTTGIASQTVSVQGDVYNYANAAFEKDTGNGTFTSVGPTTWTLDFGTVTQNSTDPTANLLVRNTPTGLTDLLNGSAFNIGAGSGFNISGFNPFNNIGGGAAFTGLVASLDTANLGTFNKQIELVWNGYNANIGGGYTGSNQSIFLNLTGIVQADGPSPISEPGVLWLFSGAGAAAWLNSRRKKAAKA